MIVLDADVVIEIERGNSKIVESLADLRKAHPENPAITSAVYAEILYGFLVRNKQPPMELESFEVIDFDKESAEIFAQKKKFLDSKGTPIPIFDLITACCAISRGALLVSLDKHYERVEGLNLLIVK